MVRLGFTFIQEKVIIFHMSGCYQLDFAVGDESGFRRYMKYKNMNYINKIVVKVNTIKL